jgi:hypothetical protein
MNTRGTPEQRPGDGAPARIVRWESAGRGGGGARPAGRAVIVASLLIALLAGALGHRGLAPTPADVARTPAALPVTWGDRATHPVARGGELPGTATSGRSPSYRELHGIDRAADGVGTPRTTPVSGADGPK